MSAASQTDCARSEQAALAAILNVLHERTGVDFSRYRAATVTRRIVNRMISIGAPNFENYLGVLRTNAAEPLRLLERVTIKVSRFYRNPVTFDALREQVIPALMELRGGQPLRLWSAGCGNGEEPYTLAMLLDAAGASGSVHASDIDPAALARAEQARYDAAAVAELPQSWRDRYLESYDDEYLVRPHIRKCVRFSHHDLTSDAPPPGEGNFDLVCCRNVLIYFDRAVQEHALRAVRRAVSASGFLCLGEAEWPATTIAHTLEPLTHKTRIFRDLCRPGPWTRK